MFNILYFTHISFHHNLTKIDVSLNPKPHCHSLYEILFVIKGNNEFLIENKTYKVTDNSLFIFPPETYHTLLHNPDENYERCIMYFDQNLIPPCLTIETNLNVIVSDEIKALFLKFDKFADEFETDALYYLLISFLHELLIRVTYSRQDSISHSNLPALVKQTVNYINQNLDQPLNLNVISQNLFVSKSHLCHIFLKNMQISIMDFIRMKKMYRAQNLLSRGFSPTQVSKLLSYDSYSTFLRNYKAIFHANPSVNEVEEKILNDFTKE